MTLHTVAAGESLWSIAEARLGAGSRWPEIVAANPGVTTLSLRPGRVLTLPALAKETAMPAVGYTFHTDKDSPNYNAGVIALPASRCVLHWWGAPSGQDPWGIVAWLCDPAAQVSAHAVIWPSNVVCLVPYDGCSWANGNDTANNTAITLECDPNDIDGTIPTVVAYLADLVRQGVLHPQFTLTGHRDWHPTECPGGYYPRLVSIRAAVRAALAGTPVPPAAAPTPAPNPAPTTPEDPMATDPNLEAILLAISAKLTGLYDQITPGKEGVKEAGAVWLALAARPEPVDVAAISEAVARGVAAALAGKGGAL